METGNEEREHIVGAALRLALAEKLEIDAEDLDGLETPAAAAALSHFVGREPGPEQLPEWAGNGSLDEQRNELIAFGIRAALAYELGVGVEQVRRMNVIGAAHALDRIRTLPAGSEGEEPVGGPERPTDDEQLVSQTLRSVLAEHLDLPASAVAAIPNDLAAHILARVIDLRVRAHPRPALAGQAEGGDRRDLLARVVRDAIAHDIEVHPRLLGSLDPTAAALLLGRFAQARRTLEVLRSNVATDELTDALRRSAGELELEREIGRVRRTGNGRLLVAFLDVDSLKLVNDSYGHSAGDELLRQLVAALQNRLRAYDRVVRWGGDEFLVILPQADAEDAQRIMTEIRDQFVERTGQSFSFGLAGLEAEETGADLVRRADQRLYEAKRGGRTTPVALEAIPAAENGAEPGEPVLAEHQLEQVQVGQDEPAQDELLQGEPAPSETAGAETKPSWIRRFFG